MVAGSESFVRDLLLFLFFYSKLALALALALEKTTLARR